ncbi:unnamed protein product [marine sediment metagenome]|uniref:Uncharacterized protein n=1 Tax=marine sediment metagenome TaxID=412755 RepID=X0WX58_9ZZZZ
MSTIDSMVRRYFQWKRDLGAPGLNPIEQEGFIESPECGCTPLKHLTTDAYPVCGHCGTPWAQVAAVRLRGTFQRSPRINPEARLAGWIDIGVVVGAFMHERRQLAEVVLRRIEMGQSLRAIAAELGCSVRRVREAEDQGRRELTSRFVSAGFDIT